MKQDFIKGKVDFCIFDRTFKNSTCLYDRYKHTDPLILSEIDHNRKAVANVFGQQDIVTVKQVHGNDVLVLNSRASLSEVMMGDVIAPSEFSLAGDSVAALEQGADLKQCMEFAQKSITADAIVTNIPGLVIAVQTADCAPALLASSCGSVVGVVHCGWRSARADIIKNTITKMHEVLASNLKDNRGIIRSQSDIVAFIGPCIRQESYEVDDNFFHDFIKESESNLRFFQKPEQVVANLEISKTSEDYRTKATHKIAEQVGVYKELNDKYQFDLPAYVTYKLQISGVQEIHFSAEDTYTTPLKYPSRRRSFHEGKEYKGNILSAIMIRIC